MKVNKYHDTIKLEFKELLRDFIVSKRRTFHCYTIHRALTMGLLIGFTFNYVSHSECQKDIHIDLNLEEYGIVTFYIDIESGYGNILNTENRETVIDFIENFSTELSRDTYQRKQNT